MKAIIDLKDGCYLFTIGNKGGIIWSKKEAFILALDLFINGMIDFEDLKVTY